MRPKRAFTLVEILIVVVILGILAAIVVPQFSNATEEAASGATIDQLTKVRESVAVFYVRNGNTFPSVTAGNGTWGGIVTTTGDYLKVPPKNLWVGPPNDTLIQIGVGPDTTFHTNYGWIFDPATGDVWAAAFDGNDQPFPRP